MKRLVIITVGKTHSGKTTFAKTLEQKLNNSIVMDQDNHGAFINMYYRNLQPKSGPNTLKHSISQLIVDYAKEHSNCHLIICNSNRSRKDRTHLLEQLFPEEKFIRILVHFDLPDQILESRVAKSERSTKIFRGSSSFEQVLRRQNADENVSDPVDGEADYLFVIEDREEVDNVIDRIVAISNSGNR